MKIQASSLLIASLLAISACGAGNEPADEAAVQPTEQADAPMDSMPGMAGMGGMQSGSAMQRMQAHMEAMTGAGADSMAALMPAHRQMAANMLAQMNREMQEMNMSADEAWTATVDSVRQDLTRMPELTPEDMAAFMPAHRERMNRLMEMHRSMMGNMRM